MSYLTDEERAAIPNDMLPGPPVTIAKASETHWPKEDITIGKCWYHYSRTFDEFIRFDVLYWVDARRRNQTKEATQ